MMMMIFSVMLVVMHLYYFKLSIPRCL